MKLSVVLATLNEEKNINDCLKSVSGLADEIIVIDGGSTDKTVEIAKKYGSKVTITNNPSIFHINKQKGVEQAIGEWILQLDADERITNELKTEILTVINPDNTKLNGFWIPRMNYFMCHWMKKGGLYPDAVIRLFKNGKGKFPCKNVHEQISIDGRIGTLKNPMQHFAFPNFDSYLYKFETYTNLRKEEIKNHVKKPSIWNGFYYFFVSPMKIFYQRFLRHKGFEDGLPGFIFAVASAYHEIIAYSKFYSESKKEQRVLPV